MDAARLAFCLETGPAAKRIFAARLCLTQFDSSGASMKTTLRLFHSLSQLLLLPSSFTAPSRRGRLAACGLLAMASLLAGVATAQTYPARPVRVIVPSGAGGNNDVTTRGLAQALADSLGQAFVVDNRGGAEGIIGTEACARAVPDGYTLCSKIGRAHV